MSPQHGYPLQHDFGLKGRCASVNHVMDVLSDLANFETRDTGFHVSRRYTFFTVVMLVAVLSLQCMTTLPGDAAPIKATLASLDGSYPIGTPDSSAPSGMSPPSATALPGYELTYQNDFSGNTLPPGWDVYTGIPGGDPGGHFGSSHVVVGNGVLELNTFRDPAWHDRWVTGGLCQCQVSQRYGAYFVRSRVSGPGPTEVELLWPTNNAWPPEIDFNETGGSVSETTSSVHFGKLNNIVRDEVNINMTAWHTWGVIWTPTSIIYTVDGRIWGEFKDAKDISAVPMTLDFEQRQECEEHRQCPSAPESMEIDWVAEYGQVDH